MLPTAQSASSDPQLQPDLRRRKAALAAGHAGAVQRMFDRISPTYDVLNRLLSLGIDARWRRRALGTLEQGLPAGPVVDLCAGTLDLTRALQQRLPGRAIFAVDFARDMLRVGRDKARGALLIQADALRLPLRDASVAGIVCGFGLRNLADPAAGLREAARVLVPGGRLVILELFRPVRWPTRLFHVLYARVVLPLVGRLVSGDAEAYLYLARSMRGFLSRAEVEAAMRQAGLREVGGEDLTLGIASIAWGTR